MTKIPIVGAIAIAAGLLSSRFPMTLCAQVDAVPRAEILSSPARVNVAFPILSGGTQGIEWGEITVPVPKGLQNLERKRDDAITAYGLLMLNSKPAHVNPDWLRDAANQFRELSPENRRVVGNHAWRSLVNKVRFLGNLDASREDISGLRDRKAFFKIIATELPDLMDETGKRLLISGHSKVARVLNQRMGQILDDEAAQAYNLSSEDERPYASRKRLRSEGVADDPPPYLSEDEVSYQ